ncbi:seven transmembrane protein 1-like isoform X2 [Asparagus officinalis]|uniref:seven transmembrane protein 1-like isoform X2 n=1 Tax=Asparagus officinalis TaxID=4686 RepID=UPI00098E7157|nr:seven transmembrane protein 1-like isoform X2 [Asparagus officinalis]
MEFRDTTFNKLLQNQITPDGMAPCVNGCVRWVEVYFKDCVCDLSSGISFGLGLLSLSCWAIAEIPQIITNFQTKSGHGVSLCFLLTWVTGDVFNLVGCVLEPATLPTQFYSAVLYAVTTLVLVVQTIYYDDCFTRWWKHRGYGPTLEVDEERKPLNPDKYGPTMPISATVSTATSPQMDVHYTSATSLANSGSSPYGGASYLRVARSGPSDFGAALQDLEEEEHEHEHEHKINITRPKRIASHSVGYGTFVLGFACLPFQAKALIQMDLYGKYIIQETIMNGLEANTYGMILGWIMAAIYMGGRLPQIYLNIKRGNVEGLNPLMFIFALIANATYVGSILVRSVRWDRLKANAPWLLDAIVCVLLDLLKFNTDHCPICIL